MVINLAILEAPPVSRWTHMQLFKMSSNSLKTTKSAKTPNMCMLTEHYPKARASVYWVRIGTLLKHTRQLKEHA